MPSSYMKACHPMILPVACAHLQSSGTRHHPIIHLQAELNLYASPEHIFLHELLRLLSQTLAPTTSSVLLESKHYHVIPTDRQPTIVARYFPTRAPRVSLHPQKLSPFSFRVLQVESRLLNPLEDLRLVTRYGCSFSRHSWLARRVKYSQARSAKRQGMPVLRPQLHLLFARQALGHIYQREEPQASRWCP
jgi:hypothetical protein